MPIQAEAGPSVYQFDNFIMLTQTFADKEMLVPGDPAAAKEATSKSPRKPKKRKTALSTQQVDNKVPAFFCRFEERLYQQVRRCCAFHAVIDHPLSSGGAILLFFPQ